MSETAKIIHDGKEFEVPVITGTENEKALDISSLRSQSGLITLDYGYKNTDPRHVKSLHVPPSGE